MHFLRESPAGNGRVNTYAFTHGCFVSSLDQIGTVVLQKMILNVVNVFSLFHYYLPFQIECDPLHLINLIPLHLRVFCDRFGSKKPCGPAEDDFKICHCILTISLLSPLVKRA